MCSIHANGRTDERGRARRTDQVDLGCDEGAGDGDASRAPRLLADQQGRWTDSWIWECGEGILERDGVRHDIVADIPGGDAHGYLLWWCSVLPVVGGEEAWITAAPKFG